jgi:lipopolysaccharide/colanic/teichoic acid biosynthesis glycosyltransferase
MIRLLDILVSFFSLLLLSPLFILIFLIGLLDTGLPLFTQKRVGYNLKTFTLLKFRTMKIGTSSSGTHLIDRSNVTYFGNFLRKWKLDELPQLLNVLIGHMSLVGPRPCLSNQKRLIIERKIKGVYKVKPGITGLAQFSGINMSKPALLAKTDLKMIKQMNLVYYIYYIFMTVFLIITKRS